MPTARTTLAANASLAIICDTCGHTAEIDLQRLIAAGRGDQPIRSLRFRCEQCGGTNTSPIISGNHVRPY